MPKKKEQITAIATLDKLVPAVIFKKGGISPILSAIQDEISNEVPDTSTVKGRKAIASNAYKVSQSKKVLDDMGKALADDLNAKLKPINAERKLARDELDALRDKTRLPLDEWEAEQERIEAKRIADESAKKLAEQLELDQEMALLMNEKIDREIAEENARIERERIAQEEQAERDRKEREQEVAREAAAKARQEAEDRAEAARLEEERKLNEERDRVANEKAESIAREKAAIQATKDAEAKAKQDKIDADKRLKDQAAQAKREQEEAIERERQRVIDQKAADDAEAVKREKNKKHKAKINNESLADLIAGGIDEKTAKKVIGLIANNKVANITIFY